ncbi:MAG: aminotransferase class I/II-fold pyridoxal phosphate-dependent enzyme [Frankia sp.]
MTTLANDLGAINLGQGMPDFDGPELLRTAAAAAMAAGHNQYAPSAGHPELRAAVAAHVAGWGLDYGDDEVTVTAGATEALAAAMFALLRPGDEVIVIEPFYDSYPAIVAMAGATMVPVALSRTATGPRLEAAPLAAAVGPRTRVVLMNTPHNPTGRVLDLVELGHVARLAVAHDLVVVTDEVYGDLWYERPHRSLATLPGMRGRTVVCSSASKSLSICGWRVGWALAPPALSAALRVTHRFATYCAAVPLQLAVAAALRECDRDGYFDRLRDDYRERRDVLVEALSDVGLEPTPAEGATFVLADTTGWREDEPLEVARWLARSAGVAALPLTSFCSGPGPAQGLLRFAFCKDLTMLREAGSRLRAHPAAHGHRRRRPA